MNKINKVKLLLLAVAFVYTLSFAVSKNVKAEELNLTTQSATSNCVTDINELNLKPGESITIDVTRDCDELIEKFGISKASLVEKSSISVKITNTGTTIKAKNGSFWMVTYKVEYGSKTMYCVEPKTPYGTGGYSISDDIEKYIRRKLSVTNANKVMYAGLWGTRYYKSTGSNSWYVATQMYITEKLLGTSMTSTSSTANSYYTKLNTLVNEFTKRQSFNGKTYTIEGGKSLTITDTSGQYKYFTAKDIADFKSKTGLNVTISGSKVTFTNPITNNKSTTQTLSFEKYKGYFPTDSNFGLVSTSSQDYGYFSYKDPVYSGVKITTKSVLGNAIFNKKLDGIDYYGKNIKDEDGNLVYNTTDGKFKYVEENGLVTSVDYPTESVMKEQDLYGKNISYKAPILIPSLEEKVRLDENNLPIQKIDPDTNLPMVDVDGNPIFETEQVQRKTTDDQPIYEQQIIDGEKQYQDVTLDIKYYDENGMKNIASGDGISFDLFTSANKFVKNVKTAANGNFTFTDLVPGSYYILEKETKDGYKLDAKRYSFNITTGTTTKINSGNPIWNYALAGTMSVKKIDKDFQDRLLAGAGFEVYIEKEDGTYDETSPIAYLETKEDGFGFSTLEPNKYVFKEIVAPHGYTVNPIEFRTTITDGKTTELSIENEQIKEDFTFKKVASEKINFKLSGGKFGVYSKSLDGKLTLLNTFSADKTKDYTFTGSYDMNEVCFIELEAPEGRKLDKTPMCYKIDEAGFYNDVTMVNELEEIIIIPRAGGIK